MPPVWESHGVTMEPLQAPTRLVSDTHLKHGLLDHATPVESGGQGTAAPSAAQVSLAECEHQRVDGLDEPVGTQWFTGGQDQ